MESKKIKFIVHEVARILVIAAIVVFVVPTIAQILELIFPASKDPAGGAWYTSVKEFALSLCFLYAILEFIPAGVIMFFALCTIVGVFDLVWRTKRGHKLRPKKVVMISLAVGMPLFLFITGFHL